MAAPLPPRYPTVVTPPPGSGSVFNLDWGQAAQFVRTWLGPSLGWQDLPVAPQLYVTSAAPLVIQPQTSRVLLKAAVTAIQLPSVVAWVTANTALMAQGPSDGRSLWIKDLSGTAGANPITLTPFGVDQIDQQPSFQIITINELIRFYPIQSDLSGWFVG
jgi:hypothetical protein